MMKLAGLDLMKLHPTPTAQDHIIGPKSQLEQFLALLAALYLVDRLSPNLFILGFLFVVQKT